MIDASPSPPPGDALSRLSVGLRWWWRHQRHWLLALIPFGLLLWQPLRWCGQLWFISESQQTYQVFIPLGAALLTWLRRDDIRRVSDELAQLFPNPNSWQRRGNLSVVLLASVLFLAAYLAIIPPLAIFAAVVAVVGGIYYMYGPFLLRPLIAPLLYLTLCVPLPTTAIQTITMIFRRLSTIFGAQTLNTLRTKADIQNSFNSIHIKSNNFELPVTASFSGILLTASVFSIALLWVLARRTTLGRSLLLLLLSLLIPGAINLLWLLMLGRIAAINPGLTKSLLGLPRFPLLLISLALLYGAERFISRRRTPRLPWAEPPPPL